MNDELDYSFPDPPVSDSLKRLFYGLVVGLFALLTFIYTLTSPDWLTWAHGGADGGELSMASALGGIAHPPGYGLYMLIGGVFTHLPGINPARGMIWFSMLSAVGAAFLVGIAVESMLRNRPLVERGTAAITSGAVVAFSQAFWSQAIIVEVYAFMGLLFCALLTLSLSKNTSSWRFLLIGHIFGLALTHHLTALIWLPGLLLLIRGWTPRKALFAGVGVVSGLYPYLILLLRAGRVPAADWGGIETGLPAFFDHITGALYRPFLQPITPAVLVGGITDWLARLPNDLAFGGLILVLVGIVSTVRARRVRLLLASLIWCVGIAAFTGIYGAEDTSIPYRLPLSAVMAIFAGFGIAGILRWTQRSKNTKGSTEYRVQSAEEGKARNITPSTERENSASVLADIREREGATGQRIAFAIGAVVIIMLLVWNGTLVSVAHDHAPADFVADTQELFPGQAVLITGSSAGTFTLWYAQHVEGTGDGWVIIDRNLWRFGWYRADLAQVYPILPPMPSDGVALDAWLRDPFFDTIVIGSDVGMMPPPRRTAERVDSWNILRPPEGE